MDDDENQQNSPQAPVLESRNDIIERIKYRRTRLLAGQHPAPPVDPEHEWRVVGQPKWYSSTPIEQLERINIEDMVAPKVHKVISALYCNIFK
ncbi:hypothetical protein PILCRDRAFT_17527 [Piloderma croceum F 1598]|uniref:Uncharacterized protein n=1 Tax=Piloderma croceum (strain F 1598) TaxID=765440 RepID=A0A0C3B154_PILCF|nr:hypothetical protein PILCRDRAFT_17527 [Piloderma croceum F 1598]